MTKGNAITALRDKIAITCAINTKGCLRRLRVTLFCLAVLQMMLFTDATAAPDPTDSRAPIQPPVQTPAQTSSATPAPPPGQPSKLHALSLQEMQAVTLLNQARKNAGLEPLKINLKLSKLAVDYAVDMHTRKFFAHVDPDGKDPFERMAAIGIDLPNAGENIALAPDVEICHKMLMDSPLHRENILNPKFTEIGIGVRPDSRGGVYMVQEFIGP